MSQLPLSAYVNSSSDLPAGHREPEAPRLRACRPVGASGTGLLVGPAGVTDSAFLLLAATVVHHLHHMELVFMSSHFVLPFLRLVGASVLLMNRMLVTLLMVLLLSFLVGYESLMHAWL